MKLLLTYKKKLCLKRLSPTFKYSTFFLVGLQNNKKKKTKKLKELKFQTCLSREETLCLVVDGPK